MVITFFVQLYMTKGLRRGRLERASEAFICQLITASVSLPLIDYFTDMPPSIIMLVGAVIGTLGLSGWEKLAHSLVAIIFTIIDKGRNHQYILKDDDDDEPPMPIKRKNK